MTPRSRLRLEPLESRRAPATLAADHKSVTFTDIDGDTAAVTFSLPVLTDANAASVLRFAGGFGPGDTTTPQQLQTIDLTAAGLPAGLSVTVKATAVVGDGTVDVGWVNATGKDAGTINISGDLGRVTAGDATTKTSGLRALTVGSIGVKNLATQEPIGASLASDVTGPLGALTVGGEVHWASVSVTGGADGKIGRVRVGGALTADPTAADTGLIRATGAIGPVTIGGDIAGGDQPNSGLRAGGTLGPVTVLGNVQGGLGADSAALVGDLGIKGLTVGTATAPKSVTGGAGPGSAAVRTAGGDIGPVKITGSLTAGAGPASAVVRAVGGALKAGSKIGAVTVTGDVTGVAADSGAIRADGSIGPVHVGSLSGVAAGSGRIASGGAIAGVRVDRDVTGGTGDYSGAITAVGSIQAVTIGGSVTGSGGRHSGAIEAGTDNVGPAPANLGPVTIRGDLTGGTGDYSAAVQAFTTVTAANKVVGGRIAAVTVVGDVTGGAGKFSAALYAQDRIGRVLIGTATGRGSLTGGGGPSSASITAAGAGIAAVTVSGDITGGGGDFSASIDTNGALGPVAVRANGQGAKGDLTGGGGTLSASLQGRTVSRVTIAGSVTGGHGANGASIIADRTVGLVAVGGDWTGASIAAGVSTGNAGGDDGYFGTADDAKVFAGSIAGITIGGTASGSADAFSATDHFAFTAAWVKALKINGVVIALKPGPGNDMTPIPIEPPAPALPTGDFVVVELP